MRLTLSLLFVLVAVTSHAKALPQDAWLCAIGQFSNADRTATVEIGNGTIGLGDACPMVAAKVKGSKKRLVLRARWGSCEGYDGPVRVRATLATGTCDAVDVRVRAKKAKRRFAAARSKGDPADCRASDTTFDQVQRRIFGAKGCRVETCHGSAKSGGLDLRPGAAYASLVSVPAVGAPGALRVAPGDSANSFLVRKLAGVLAAGEGSRMPSIGSELRALEIDLVRAWIDAGAPDTGTVSDAPCPPSLRFEEAKPLPPPPGGYQIVYEGPILQPGEEMEGCEWIRVPNGADFAVGQWEFSVNPGTHHFALWEHRADAPEPPLNEWNQDIACIQGGARYGINLSITNEAPYYVDQYPGNYAKVVKGGSLLGINPHYFNEYDVPIQVKLWLNLHPAAPNATLLDTIASIDAHLDGKTPYSILVPPHTTGTLRVRWHNNRGTTLHIPQLASHMHQRGVRFDAWRSDGSPLYQNVDWAHPRILNFDPPLTLEPGDYIEYQCTHDNGVERPVRTCGDSYLDTSCTPGEPLPLKFGVTAQDEMCILTGLLY